MDLPINEILCGEAKTELAKLPADSINCCISSPPYWALRDYGTATWEGGDPECDHKIPANELDPKYPQGTSHNIRFIRDNCYKCGAKRIDQQLGLEPTFEEYIDKLCGIYDEVKRVLRPDGTCWVNLGDTYAGSGRGGGGSYEKMCQSFRRDRELIPKSDFQVPGIVAKSLCLIPQRFAIEMVNRGWILRNVIIWHKPNPMPSSAKDRFTVDFEYIYFFSKRKKYWFEPQYEAHQSDTRTERLVGGTKSNERYSEAKENGVSTGTRMGNNPLGRNKRTVWTIPTQSFPEAHFATYPEKLVEPMVKSGCPEFICKKCGKARVKIYEKIVPGKALKQYKGKEYNARKGVSETSALRSNGPEYNKFMAEHPPAFKGYTDCGCGAGWRPGIIIDIFAGSGTSCLVAAQNRRDWIGIELNQEYIEMAMRRINTAETGVPVAEQRQGQMGLFEK